MTQIEPNAQPASLTALSRAIARHDSLSIAVSGGVDSMTLAHAAHQVLGAERSRMCHAVSPAVPAAATKRVKDHAARYGWKLLILNAREFENEDYLRNPVNRCYFCKSNLYTRIFEEVNGKIASGTNTDDLTDFRPGLKAAKERDVCHPFVEAGLSKNDVRTIARHFDLDDVSELPAQPCLASRIETGLRVSPSDLQFVEQMESHLSSLISDSSIRCRVTLNGIRVEVSEAALKDPEAKALLAAHARDLCQRNERQLLDVTPYVKGSAFRYVTK